MDRTKATYGKSDYIAIFEANMKFSHELGKVTAEIDRRVNQLVSDQNMKVEPSHPIEITVRWCYRRAEPNPSISPRRQAPRPLRPKARL